MYSVHFGMALPNAAIRLFNCYNSFNHIGDLMFDRVFIFLQIGLYSLNWHKKPQKLSWCDPKNTLRKVEFHVISSQYVSSKSPKCFSLFPNLVIMSSIYTSMFLPNYLLNILLTRHWYITLVFFSPNNILMKQNVPYSTMKEVFSSSSKCILIWWYPE